MVSRSSFYNQATTEIQALAMTVNFDRAIENFGSSSIPLGERLIETGPLKGLTVDQLLLEARAILNKGITVFSETEILQTITIINQSYVEDVSVSELNIELIN